MECYFIEVLQHVDDNDFKRILRQEPLGAYELSTHPTPVKTKKKSNHETTRLLRIKKTIIIYILSAESSDQLVGNSMKFFHRSEFC